MSGMTPPAGFGGYCVICGEKAQPGRVTDANAVLGQLTILREPESTASTAGSAAHTNGKVGCRSLFAIDPTVPRWQRNGCRFCPTAG